MRVFCGPTECESEEEGDAESEEEEVEMVQVLSSLLQSYNRDLESVLEFSHAS
jgi:hypothetical protein